MKRILIIGFFSLLLHASISSAVPFLHDERLESGILPVLDTQGISRIRK